MNNEITNQSLYSTSNCPHNVYTSLKKGFFQVPVSVCSDICPPGTRKLSRKGEPFCCFDCIPCTFGEYSNSTDTPDCLRCPKEQWSSEDKSTCIHMPMEFLSFSDPLTLSLLGFALLGNVMALMVAVLLISFWKRLILKSTNFVVHCIMLVAIEGCFGSSMTFVGQPTDLLCQLRHPLTSVCLNPRSCLCACYNNSTDSFQTCHLTNTNFLFFLHDFPKSTDTWNTLCISTIYFLSNLGFSGKTSAC
uniref:G-protein coupled receptors family 3 profile domain-containing protein n=1 Tax=Eptatretus burgeri TaxID=7764 RepID=A0A8C4QJ08_EPTBU